MSMPLDSKYEWAKGIETKPVLVVTIWISTGLLSKSMAPTVETDMLYWVPGSRESKTWLVLWPGMSSCLFGGVIVSRYVNEPLVIKGAACHLTLMEVVVFDRMSIGPGGLGTAREERHRPNNAFNFLLKKKKSQVLRVACFSRCEIKTKRFQFSAGQFSDHMITLYVSFLPLIILYDLFCQTIEVDCIKTCVKNHISGI